MAKAKALRTYAGGLFFNHEENQFYCGDCGSKAYWYGGRWHKVADGSYGCDLSADECTHPEHQHMEVIQCCSCGHCVDPRLVIETFTKSHEIYKAELRNKLYKAMVEAVKQEYERVANTFGGRLRLAFGMEL